MPYSASRPSTAARNVRGLVHVAVLRVVQHVGRTGELHAARIRGHLPLDRLHHLSEEPLALAHLRAQLRKDLFADGVHAAVVQPRRKHAGELFQLVDMHVARHTDHRVTRKAVSVTTTSSARPSVSGTSWIWRRRLKSSAGGSTMAVYCVTSDSACRGLLHDQLQPVDALVKVLADQPDLVLRQLAAPHDAVHIQPVRLVGRHAAGRGVRLLQVPHLLQVGHLIANGRTGEVQAGTAADRPRTDGRGREHILVDDGFQNLQFSRVQLHRFRLLPGCC